MDCVRSKNHWQKIGEGHDGWVVEIVYSSDLHLDFGRVRSELDEELAANPARGAAIGGDHGDLPDFSAAFGDHANGGGPLRADRASVGEILDVRSDVNPSMLVFDRRADEIATVRRIGSLADRRRGGEKIARHAVIMDAGELFAMEP